MLLKHDKYFTIILLLLASNVLGYSDIPSFGEKECNSEYPEVNVDYAYEATEGTVNGIDHPDVGFLVFDSESAIDDVAKEQPTTEESLRESLKKQLEFCFSR